MPVVIKNPNKDDELELFGEKDVIQALKLVRENYHDIKALPVAVSSPSRKYRLSSAMQKAFRRGDPELLVKMMSGLHSIDKHYTWRRFGVVVMEDAGTCIAKFRHVFAAYLWLVGSNARRIQVGVTPDDLMRFARFFCMNLDRCRYIQDLTSVCAWTEGKPWRDKIGQMQPSQIKDLDLPAPTKLLFCGDNRIDPVGLTKWWLDTHKSHMPEKGYHWVDRWIALESARQRYGGMFSLYPYGVATDDSTEAVDEVMPPAIWIGAYPGYCFDMHVSEGAKALRYFLAMKETPYVQYVTDLAKGDRDKMYEMTREPLFPAEIARLVRRRRNYSSSVHSLDYSNGGKYQTLSVNVFAKMHGVSPDQAQEQIGLLFDAIPQLNYARQKVVQP